MKYRPEIDGLRAVAVVPVILFHAGFGLFSGGFVGVDVFFVISGYLITTLLLEDIERERFSLLRFYERRIRRIFPALFLVVLFCVPAAWMLMLPDQLKDFSQSIAAVLLFVSNVLFWKESGYFGGASALKPLLHTWSLAVEEQYYVFFPLLLFGLSRIGRKATVLVLLALLLASLAATEWGWRFARMANFFLTPFRIWELLAGSLCAIVLRQRTVPGNQLLSALGLVMVLAAVFLFDEATPFPSLLALLPVGGSCLCVLFARPGTLVARVLTTPICVGIGLISYSAYLWHQPLFAFTRMASPYKPAESLMLGLSVLSLVLAYFSWRFVEQPFRRRDIPILASRRNIFAFASVAAVALMAVAVVGHVRDGFPDRFDPSLDKVLAIRDEWLKRRQSCHIEGEPKQHPIPACLVEAGHPKIDVAMIGDSHSLAISEMVQDELKKDGLTSYAVSYSGCIGLPGFYRVDLDAQHQCDRFNRELLKFIEDQGITTVILTSRFPLYLSGDRFNNGEGGVESGEPAWIDEIAYRDEAAPRDDPARQKRVLEGYRTGILDLLDKFNVVLVYPIPEAGWDVVRHVVTDTIRGGHPPEEVSTDMAAYEARNTEVLPLFDSLEHPYLRKVIPALLFCNSMLKGRCVNSMGARVFYRDEDHLSYEGARLLAPEIAAAALSLVGKERP